MSEIIHNERGSLAFMLGGTILLGAILALAQSIVSHTTLRQRTDVKEKTTVAANAFSEKLMNLSFNDPLLVPTTASPYVDGNMSWYVESINGALKKVTVLAKPLNYVASDLSVNVVSYKYNDF